MELTEAEQKAAEDAVQEIEAFRETGKKIQLKVKPVRKVLPEDIPRREEHIYPEIDEIDNREVYEELPPEITEVLEHEPGKCYVRKIIRHKYILKVGSDDLSTSIVTASLPSLPLPKSYACATLLSELAVSKYVDHQPYYRQIQMFKRDGVTLPASTINGWHKDLIDLLRPMYYRLQETVLDSDYLQIDETTIPVIIKEEHKTKKGYLWLFRSVNDSLQFFHYDNGSRAQKVVTAVLPNYQGTIQTDGYEAYSIYENKSGVIHLGCFAHARRKWTESLTNDKERAEYALSQIGLLYSGERKADTEKLTNEERKELRNRLSLPIITSFEKWMLREYPKVLPSKPHWKGYQIYLQSISHTETLSP